MQVPADVRIWIVALTAPEKRRRRAQARAELEAVLAQELGAAVQDLGIVRADGGKPQLPDRLVNFNLSHSGQIALIAVSRVRGVGVDVEAARAFKNRPGLARRICSPQELAHLARTGAPGDPESDQLLRLWVRKEAVVKATGEGLTVDLTRVDVLADEVQVPGRPGQWRCVDLPSPAPGYVAALAFASDAADAPA